jgi:hypothetical protein
MDHLPPRTEDQLEIMHERARKGRTNYSNLRERVLYPTPRANKVNPMLSEKIGQRNKSNLEEEIAKNPNSHGRYLNPQFVEEMMGYPIGWATVD